MATQAIDMGAPSAAAATQAALASHHPGRQHGDGRQRVTYARRAASAILGAPGRGQCQLRNILWGGNVSELSKEQLGWLKGQPVFPPNLVLTTTSGNEATYEILERGATGAVSAVAERHGYKGFVLKVRDPDTHLEFAAKLCVADDYLHRDEKTEAQLASRLRNAGDLFVLPQRVGKAKRFDGMPGDQEHFVCFITPWVEGQTLAQFLSNSKNDVDPEFLCSVGMDVLRAIKFLTHQGLKHDDLHTGNVMISVIDPALALVASERNRQRISIIDMGSLKPLGQTTTKSRDDRVNLVDILVQLYNGVWANRKAVATHPVFVARLRELIQKLTDDDPLRHFVDEDKVAGELANLRDSLQVPIAQGATRVFHPFEAISAEHLADDATLLELFVSTLPWMSSLQENKPVVFSGPRGCGKSMLFRYLAARTHVGQKYAQENGQPPSQPRSFGVYVSCATHLQNNLSWIARKSGRARLMSHQVSTYFQLVVVRELLKALGSVYNDRGARHVYQLTESGLDELMNAIVTYFNVPVETPRLTTRQRIFHFADDLDRLRVRLHMGMLNDSGTEFVLPDTFLGDVTLRLVEALPHFRHCPVVFLLDDYTANRVQPEIQEILNRIVFERRHTHYFKISCEKYGFTSQDIDGAGIDDTREYVAVDAGKSALDGISQPQVRQFISKLIDRRLEKAGWKGRVATLIGDSAPFASDVALAQHIRTAGSSQGQQYYYYGIDHLSRLWSGDTATVLQIVREMFALGGIRAESEQLIIRKTQHTAITSVSKAFKERVSGYHPYGALMATVLSEYGSAARDILVNGALDSKQQPRRLYRIEMTKQQPGTTLELIRQHNADAASLARELLRRAIFVELLDSRGKEGPSAHTMRWELRKIFLPAFGLSLERKSYYDVKGIDKLLQLLVDAQGFGDEMRQQYMLGRNQDRRTGSLFTGDGHE